MRDEWGRRADPGAAGAGLHRVVWDLRHPPPAVPNFSYPIAAVRANTPRVPRGVTVAPGTYTVRLRVDGAVQTAPLTVRMDPRVKTPAAGLALQYTTARAIDAALARVATTLADVQSAPASRADAARTATGALTRAQGQAAQLLGLVEGVDLPPTPQVLAAWRDTAAAIDAAIAAWTTGR